MQSEEAFDQWCWQLGLSDQAKEVITRIRTSNPSHRVQGSAGNVSGTYPSLKMGFVIQFESHENELPFAYQIDHDPDVLELYDQPTGEIKLRYRNKDDTRNVTTKHTPDFFVLRKDGAGWHIDSHDWVTQSDSRYCEKSLSSFQRPSALSRVIIS